MYLETSSIRVDGEDGITYYASHILRITYYVHRVPRTPYNGTVLQVCSATPNDAAVLARFRVMLFKEMGRLEGDAAEFAQSSEGYFSWALSTGREVAWVAEDMGEPVAVLAMTLEPMPPKPGRPRLVEAYMHNVYVLPDRRMRGLAKRLVTAAPEYANKKGVRRVRLFTSDDVRRMYENLGFEPHGRYLEIKL